MRSLRNKISFKLRSLFNKNLISGNFSESMNLQNENYNQCNLSREEGEKLLNKVLKKLDYPLFSKDGKNSEHLLIISSLALIKKNVKNILEIGTLEGKTSLIFSHLFPKANIFTIDLPDNDPIFLKSYGREKLFQQFIKKRNETLKKSKKIKFIQINSLKLFNLDKLLPKFDIIWVDGAHGYPVACSDIINSIKLVKNNGIILCDDVVKKEIENSKLYYSNASWETLKSLESAGILSLNIFKKRILNNPIKPEKFIILANKLNLKTQI